MTEEQEENITVWYELTCQHCDKDGYITWSLKLPVDNCNIPAEEFEIIPSKSEGYARIRSKCNQCGGMKKILYCSDEWKIKIIDPKPIECEEK